MKFFYRLSSSLGNVARELLHSERNRLIITEDIKNTEIRDVVQQYGNKLSHILRVVSSGQKVNLERGWPHSHHRK